MDINDFLFINNEDNNGLYRYYVFVILLMFVVIFVGMLVMFLKILWENIINGEEK